MTINQIMSVNNVKFFPGWMEVLCQLYESDIELSYSSLRTTTKRHLRSSKPALNELLYLLVERGCLTRRPDKARTYYGLTPRGREISSLLYSFKKKCLEDEGYFDERE